MSPPFLFSENVTTLELRTALWTIEEEVVGYESLLVQFTDRVFAVSKSSLCIIPGSYSNIIEYILKKQLEI